MNKVSIGYRKIDGKLKVVSASYYDSRDRGCVLEDMIDQTYDNENEILMAIQELLSWGDDDPGPQIEVRFLNFPEYRVATIQLNPHKSKPTINSDVLIRLMRI
jgi:hypothetical protein